MRPLAIVTGGTRGIGAGIAAHLYAQGYNVAAVYRDDDRAAAALAHQVNTGDGVFVTYRTDLTDFRQVEKLAEVLTTEYGRPEVLVNNAGTISRPSYWRDQSHLRRTPLCGETWV